MIGTQEIPLVETTRDELRDRIELARERFNRLIRTADPNARPPRSDWTVQQVVAHVLTVAQRYQSLINTGDFRRAATPAEAPVLNQTELEAVMAPIPNLAEQLDAIAPVMDAYFDTIPPETQNDRVYTFHFGVLCSAVLAQTNWLAELLFHGEDIAHAIGEPWGIDERDMLLALRGGLEIAPAGLRAGISPSVNLCVAYDVPSARPFVMHIHDGVLDARVRRPSDRPDAVVKVPASTLMRVIYQRVGPFGAVREGMRLVGGRRPWRVLKLQSYLEKV